MLPHGLAVPISAKSVETAEVRVCPSPCSRIGLSVLGEKEVAKVVKAGNVGLAGLFLSVLILAIALQVSRELG